MEPAIKRRKLPPWLEKAHAHRTNDTRPEPPPTLTFSGRTIYCTNESDALVTLKNFFGESTEGEDVLISDGTLEDITNSPSKDALDVDADRKASGKVQHVGFDMEWPINSPTALIQIYTDCPEPVCLLLHVSAWTKLPVSVLRFLERDDLIKVGVNVSGDIWKLDRDVEEKFDAHRIVKTSIFELSNLANEVYDRDDRWSLDGLVLRVLKRTLPKTDTPRLSDWSRVPLSDEQKRYAVLDAFASLAVYRRLVELRTNSRSNAPITR